MLVNLFALTAGLAGETNAGFFPGYDRKYEIDGPLPDGPVTFTAEVRFNIAYNYAASGGKPGKGGIIIGNTGSGPNTLKFGIANGYPYLMWTDTYREDKGYNYNKSLMAKFTGIETGKTVTSDGVSYPVTPMYTGETVVLTIVRDHSNEQVHCYIDGEHKQTLHYRDCLWNYNFDTFLGDQYDSANVYNYLHDPVTK